MTEGPIDFVLSLSSPYPNRKRKATFMKAFAFKQTEATATTKDIDRTPIGTDWFGARMHKGAVFSPLDDWMLKFYPTIVDIDSKCFKLTPWVVYASHWGVSPAVKEVIEGFEPGKHQFIPVELRYGHGNKFEEHDYFTLQVNAMENAVDLEKSDVTWSELPEGRGRYWRPKAAIPVVLPKSSIEGRHLWRNERISKWMMSGELRDALAHRGLTDCLKFGEHFVV